MRETGRTLEVPKSLPRVFSSSPVEAEGEGPPGAEVYPSSPSPAHGDSGQAGAAAAAGPSADHHGHVLQGAEQRLLPPKALNHDHHQQVEADSKVPGEEEEGRSSPVGSLVPCPRVGDTHAVVAISTTIMERGNHRPKQLTTDTTWGTREFGTLTFPPPVGWHALDGPGPPG